MFIDIKMDSQTADAAEMLEHETKGTSISEGDVSSKKTKRVSLRWISDKYQIKTARNLVHEQLPPPDIHFKIEKLNPLNTGFYSELG